MLDCRRATVLLAILSVSAGPAAAAPLDLTNTAPRPVQIEVENSSDPALVGQSFGPVFPATYSVAGGIGTVLVSAATHELMWSGGFPAPLPGSFTPLVFEIDLTTHHATSQAASGAFASGVLTAGFNQHALTSDAVLGFAGPTVPPLACASQQMIDDLCPTIPELCGEVCTLVSGAAVDPATGKVNLVGVETVGGCDGGICFGPFDYFARRGDVRFTEVPAVGPVPALSFGAVGVLALLLAAVAWNHAATIRKFPAKTALQYQRPAGRRTRRRRR